jgi:hypothetical protein
LITLLYERGIFGASASYLRRFQMKWNNKKGLSASGRFASFFGIIALAAVIGLSMAACGDDPEPDPITITITGIPGATYNGWEAYLAVGDDNDAISYAMPLKVTASTTSLTFEMLRMDDDKVFNTSGTYTIGLWFEKNGESDVDYVLENKKINAGANSIAFNSFEKIENEVGGDKRADLLGYWEVEGTTYYPTSFNLEEYDGDYLLEMTGGGGNENYILLVSYDGSTAVVELDGETITFTATIQGDKLTISGWTGTYDRTYTKQE